MFGQEVKTKKKKDNTREGTATFYVLATNEAVKHGDYQIKAYTGKRVLLKGTYSNNKKVGLWTEQYYDRDYTGPKATGNYENDIKTGDWTYFNYEGEKVIIYNWTDNKVVFSKLCGTDTKEYTVIEDSKESKSKLDCPPTCATGREYFLYEFMRDIGDQAKLFKEIGPKLYQLKTKISITIDKNSSVTDISYSTNENYELKEIIEKFVKSYKWIPGTKDGQKLTTKFEFSIGLSSQY
ncbi:hypothetical protein EGI26_16875 [Lacihabitans sp. CCS-44]|uniref:hypothetical protein n=1 Tax=Lacihabitans sp. CCS-44 TaxID=2487331 RepID=UPI0020CE6257|nr:hypothetical protein [Lacihabitans sp. CCS-44]MCP9756841.1 hypothetical protein [Lacihabitans sp. CCS-44]